MGERRENYRRGLVYALVTSLLYALQEPFFGEAARQLGPALFVALTQLALLLAAPLMLARRKSRRDFVALLGDRNIYGKLAVLLGLGVVTLLCLQYGLKGANPIVVAAILNLSPFWAALIAKIISRKAFPASPLLFLACFAAAFAGTMLIAFSQMSDASWQGFGRDLRHETWLLALPLPLLTALNGTLVGEWFKDYDDSATLAVNFLLSVLVVAPISLLLSIGHDSFAHATWLALTLLIVGTVASSAIGRVTYQFALTATGNDNGFVSLFLLLVPIWTALVTWPLAWLLPDLRFIASPAFFAGLVVVSAALLLFSRKASVF